MGPLSFLRALGVVFLFYISFSMKFMKANRIAPEGTPRFAASHLGLFCLSMSIKKDARLWVKLERSFDSDFLFYIL